MAKYPFRVRGLGQIPPTAEIADAKFIRRATGLYFHITYFTKPEKRQKTGQEIGLDFGILNNITTSDGKTYKFDIEESKGIKLASKRLNKSMYKSGWKPGQKHSNNHKKRVERLRVAYAKQNNKKKDIACKFVSELVKNYDFIAMQDELIKCWHSGWFGKQVQKSIMGEIKARLGNKANCHIIDSRVPSTQFCPECGCLTKHSLDKRDFLCDSCGYTHENRDIKSAQIILDVAKQEVSSERRTKSPVREFDHCA